MSIQPTSKVAPADPCALVVFGAAGDLTHRLLVPALYNLAADALLPPAFSLVGVARGERSDDAFRAELADGLHRFATGKVDEGTARRLLQGATFVDGDAADGATYQKLEGA